MDAANLSRSEVHQGASNRRGKPPFLPPQRNSGMTC